MISTGGLRVVKNVPFNSFHELRNVLVPTDSSEAFFGSLDARDAPAMSHVSAGPAFDSAADVADSAEQRFDRVRAAEELSEVAGQAQPDDRQSFFQTFPLLQNVSRGLLAASRLIDCSHVTVSSSRRFASSECV